MHLQVKVVFRVRRDGQSHNARELIVMGYLHRIVDSGFLKLKVAPTFFTFNGGTSLVKIGLVILILLEKFIQGNLNVFLIYCIFPISHFSSHFGTAHFHNEPLYGRCTDYNRDVAFIILY